LKIKEEYEGEKMKLKEAIDLGNVEKASDLLVELYISNTDNFKKSLLLSNSLPEPIGRDINNQNLEILIESFIIAQKKLIDKKIDLEKYMEQFTQILEAIMIIYKNLQSNLKRLNKNEFLSFTLCQQLQMFCIFIEDQHRLLQQNHFNERKTSNYVTGMEREVANLSVDNIDGAKTSISDNIESLIESADTLFRLLYYNAKNVMTEIEVHEYEEIIPYNIKSFQEILYLSMERNLLVNLWGKFKYREWNLYKYKKEEDIYYFKPKSVNDYKKEHIAINRYIYRDYITANKANNIDIKKNRDSMRSLDKLSESINIYKIDTLFSIKKDKFFNCNKLINGYISGCKESIEDVYFSIEHDGIKVIEILNGFEYLFTIAMIYQNSVLKNFDQDDIKQYKYLTPIINNIYLINHFKELYNLDLQKAEKIINMFIFSKRSRLDVFSQPLISVDEKRIVFCPTLIIQMNIIRIIEMLINEWKIDISDKGTDFERKLRFVLNCNPYIEVNSNKIEFEAYDGKNVEFDFIAMFNEYLLLIEFKHLRIPFTDKMKRNCENTINYGIEQVNRRTNIIKKDWDKIKAKCSFSLPEEPVKEDKIIKLVCTNIFDFSTVKKDGITIIDSSSLIKFFIIPEVKAFIAEDKVKKIAKQNLWEKEYPTVEEFKKFLDLPIAIEPYVECMKEVYKPVNKIEEDDYNICYFDYSLVKDPYESYLSDIERTNNERESKKIKVGRNDPCPCQSGKKFKKCCGK
jgi:hypothetical protein